MEEKIELFNSNKLRLAVTNACNLSCFYCHNEGQKIDCVKTYISLDYVKSMVNWIINNNIRVDYINVTGGEPMVHPQIIEIIDELKKLNCKIRLNTNATLLTKEKVDELKEHGVYSLKVGIDSVFAKQTKPSVYSTNTSVEKVLEILKYASTKMGVVLNTVTTKFNYKDIDKIINFAKESKIGRVKIIKLNDTNSRGYNDKNDLSDDIKTSQPEASWYYYFFTKYVTLASKTVNNPYKGRTDLYFDDKFEIRLCDDICTHGACGNMYTEIDCFGNVLICQRNNISVPVNFNDSFEAVSKVIKNANSSMCNSKTKNYKYRDKKYDTAL